MNETKLVIDWANMPTYNTIMALAAGVALISLASLGKELLHKKANRILGWSCLFAVLGAILTITGVHMTLTWPFGHLFPWDNILFGEPSFAFGVVLLALALYLWKSNDKLVGSQNPLKIISENLVPFRWLFLALGLMLTGIFFAGVSFQFFAAPPQEPITGYFGQWPWLENWGLSLIFLGIGICSVLTAVFFNAAQHDTYQVRRIDKLLYLGLKITGWVWLLFGALNYYTHIGFILNTIK